MLKDDLAEIQNTAKLISEHEDSSNKLRRKSISLEEIKISKNFTFWTGFPNYETFLALFNFVKPRLSSIKIWRGSSRFRENILEDRKKHLRILSYEEEFFMTILRLKTGMMVQMLAHCFGVSPCTVSNIFTSYIVLLAQDLTKLCQLPSYNTVSAHISPAMKRYVRFIYERMIKCH